MTTREPACRSAAPNRVVLGLLLLLHGMPALAGPNLQEVMKTLGDDLCRASGALLQEDYPALAAAARDIAGHPRPGMGERLKILAGLGKDAERFRSADSAVHDAATSLAEAAELKDAQAAAAHYAQLVGQCVECHAGFRQRVRALLHP
ncbi:MAG: cytochrome c [Gammaproteobacteria bacterium]|nr:cytochrome c [Gammaproteobacteria bacterium]